MHSILLALSYQNFYHYQYENVTLCPILTVNGQLNGVLKNVIFPRHHAGEGFLICHGHFSDDEAKIFFDIDSVLVVRIF